MWTNKLLEFGHPILIFSEKKSHSCDSFFYFKYSKYLKTNIDSNKAFFDNRKNYFSLSSLFFCAIEKESRKKKFEIFIRNLRFKKINSKIKHQIINLIGEGRVLPFFTPPKMFTQKKKRKIKVFTKESVFCFSFLGEKDVLVTKSLLGNIEINNYEKKKPSFLIKTKKENLFNFSTSDIFSNIFILSEKKETKIFKICNDPKKLQIFSLKHASLLSSSSFRKGENSIDYIFHGKIWKNFSLESKKWFSIQSFSEPILFMEKSISSPIFALLTTDKINIFDKRLGKNVILIKLSKNQNKALKWSQDFPDLLSYGNSGDIMMWDLRFPKKQRSVKLHQNIISKITVDPSSKLFFSSSHDKTTKIWSKNKYSLIKTFRESRGKIVDNALSESSLFLGTIGNLNNLKILPI